MQFQHRQQQQQQPHPHSQQQQPTYIQQHTRQQTDCLNLPNIHQQHIPASTAGQTPHQMQQQWFEGLPIAPSYGTAQSTGLDPNQFHQHVTDNLSSSIPTAQAQSAPMFSQQMLNPDALPGTGSNPVSSNGQHTQPMHTSETDSVQQGVPVSALPVHQPTPQATQSQAVPAVHCYNPFEPLMHEYYGGS